MLLFICVLLFSFNGGGGGRPRRIGIYVPTNTVHSNLLDLKAHDVSLFIGGGGGGGRRQATTASSSKQRRNSGARWRWRWRRYCHRTLVAATVPCTNSSGGWTGGGRGVGVHHAINLPTRYLSRYQKNIRGPGRRAAPCCARVADKISVGIVSYLDREEESYHMAGPAPPLLHCEVGQSDCKAGSGRMYLIDLTILVVVFWSWAPLFRSFLPFF